MCSTGVLVNVGGCDTGMCWGWSQRGKGDHSRLFVLELGMILVELELKKEKKRCEFTFSTLVALVLSGGPARDGAWDKARSEERKFTRGRSVGSTGDGDGGTGTGATTGVLLQAVGDTGGLDLGEYGEKRSSVGRLSAFWPYLLS